jgi:hypothetical protein
MPVLLAGRIRGTARRFRAYLLEMVGRGVLAPKDGRGWRLRSPNALRIGSHNDVTEQLVNAAESSLPDEFVALETRPILAGTRSPLSARQITDVLGDHSDQVRIVLGSDATGDGGLGNRGRLRPAATPGRRAARPVRRAGPAPAATP